MNIDRNLTRKFPRLARWIATEIPKVCDNERVFEPFARFAQLDQPDTTPARRALLHNGLPPTIDFAVMTSYGQYRPRLTKNRNKVYISRRLCRKFEKLDPDQRIMTNWGLIMKATILHEMVHWGDFIFDGVDQPNATIYDPVSQKTKRNKDVGFQFEAEAFYGIYTKEWLR